MNKLSNSLPLKIDGKKYHGIFLMNLMEYSWEGGNCEYGDRNERKFWYEGIGKIKYENTFSGTFLIHSFEKRDEKFKDIISSFNLDSNSLFYEDDADNLLGSIYESVRLYDSNLGFFPTIYLRKLKLQEIIK